MVELLVERVEAQVPQAKAQISQATVQVPLHLNQQVERRLAALKFQAFPSQVPS